jgi:hypothetical protein
MRWLAWGFALLLCVPAVGETPAEPQRTADLAEKYSSALDGSSDIPLKQAFVPSEERRHADVRLARRQSGLVVQTLINSKLLKRVVARIGQKERRNWPPDSEGYEDSSTYIDAIERAQQQIAETSLGAAHEGDRRQQMLIEFVLQPTVALVAVYEPQVRETGDELRITGKQPLAILQPSRYYVFEDMKLIVADSLELSGSEIDALFDGFADPVHNE